MGKGGTTQSTGTTNTSNIPEYAEPYVMNMLGATQRQLFNVEGDQITGFKDYKPYSSTADDYVAPFSPMQEQAMRTAASPEAFGQQVQGYMSPYMQNVVDIQKREAMRGAGIMGAQNQAQATNAGAFGGYREGIQRAENQRNLSTQMNDIQLKGQQMAFDNAQQQARMSQGQQMQFGGMQQAQEQQKINQRIQDFANAQQYPLMQLGTMSNMLRGLPMQAQTTNQYVAAPNPVSQGIGAMGTYAALNNAGMFGKPAGAEGGLPSEFKYAEGGITAVPRYDVGGEVESQLESMDIPGLMKQAQESSSPTVRAMAKRILREKQMEQGADRGAAPAGPMGVDYQAPQSMAGGGIVAFSKGDTVDEEAAARAQMKSDREAVSSAVKGVGEFAKDAAGKTVAAGADLLTMIPRGIAGAVDTAVIRPARALGADVGYISPSLTPGDQASDTMTPFYDRYIRSKEGKAAAPAAAPAAPAAAKSSARDDNFRRQPDPRTLGVSAIPPDTAAVAPAAAPAAANEGIKGAPVRAAGPAKAAPAATATAEAAPAEAAPTEAAGITAAPAVGADGKPVFSGPLSSAERAAYEAEQEAKRSEESFLEQVKKGKPVDTAAAEYRKQIMDERSNSKAENERQRQMRLAQFFAKWGSTPGPTLAAGLSALEKSLPDMISDEAGFKKAKRELDKIQFDIDHATRLEELGDRKEARALKEKAADRAMQLNHYLTQAKSAENTANIGKESAANTAATQERTSRYATDKRLEGDKLQAGASAAATAENRRLREATTAQTAYQAARNAVVDVQNAIARQENTDTYKDNVRLAKMRNSDTGKAPEGFETQVVAAEKALRDHRTRADKLINDAEADVKYTYSRLKAPEGAPQGAGAVSPATTNKGISKAEFDKLPSGARFTAPDGSIRTKP